MQPVFVDLQGPFGSEDVLITSRGLSVCEGPGDCLLGTCCNE